MRYVKILAADVQIGSRFRDPIRDRADKVVGIDRRAAEVRFWTELGRRITFALNDPVEVERNDTARQLGLTIR